MAARRLGLIVNPIAGLGGAVGLKGTDGAQAAAVARARGAVPRAPERAVATLARIAAARLPISLLTAPGDMGQAEARAAGFDPQTVAGVARSDTSAADTRRAAAHMLAAGVDLLLFAGGDGTARDIVGAIGDRLPALGIPAGVKMHSAVYGVSPQATADLVVRHLRQPLPLRDLEVMDIDEAAYRRGEVSAALYGYLKVPYDPEFIQGVKVGRAAGEADTLRGIAAEVIERLRPGELCILGPGTTTRAIADAMGVAKTLLGVDIVLDGRVVAADATERDILEALRKRRGRAVVAPIGGQGHIFGRGNQPISAAVLRQIGREAVIVAASADKLASLHHQALRVDTGDPTLDREFGGYMRVVTGYGAEAVCRVLS
jgi:predicted polyphosphate/ATP-dependent NAD kinase